MSDDDDDDYDGDGDGDGNNVKVFWRVIVLKAFVSTFCCFSDFGLLHIKLNLLSWEFVT